VTGEYEHSILKYGGPSMGNKTQHVDFHENWCNDFDYIKFIYGDHLPNGTWIRGPSAKYRLWLNWHFRSDGFHCCSVFSNQQLRIVVKIICIWGNMCSVVAAIFSLFPYFEKMKIGLWDHLAVCVCAPPPNSLWMPEQIFTKLVVYIIHTCHMRPSQRHTS
jgi:hypothetical protein